MLSGEKGEVYECYLRREGGVSANLGEREGVSAIWRKRGGV